MTQPDYNIFISWSGPKNGQVAGALRAWLPKVIQIARPWMSDEDIVPGRQWRTSIRTRLDESIAGLICLTPENLHSPWLLFEAGALSKPGQEAYVWTFLTDIKPTDVEDPLAQYQATKADKSDVLKLVLAIHSAIDTEGLISEVSVTEAFDAFWSELETAFATIALPDVPEDDLQDDPAPARADRELLEEILARLRSNDSQESRRSASNILPHTTEPTSSLTQSAGFVTRVRESVDSLLESDERADWEEILRTAEANGVPSDRATSILNTMVTLDMIRTEDEPSGTVWVRLTR